MSPTIELYQGHIVADALEWTLPSDSQQREAANTRKHNSRGFKVTFKGNKWKVSILQSHDLRAPKVSLGLSILQVFVPDESYPGLYTVGIFAYANIKQPPGGPAVMSTQSHQRHFSPEWLSKGVKFVFIEFR